MSVRVSLDTDLPCSVCGRQFDYAVAYPKGRMPKWRKPTCEECNTKQLKKLFKKEQGE